MNNKLIAHDHQQSKCCDAHIILTDICSKCKEHCDKQDFFDSHFVIIGLDGKENEEIKSKIKEQLEREVG